MLLNGPAAPGFAALLQPFGMQFSLMEGEPGSAAAVKMCRSIVVKGLEALLVECTLAARRFGCEAAVWESLSESFPGMKWSETARSMAERVMSHGTRRAAEMREVALMLREADLEPIMSEASAEAQDWKIRLGLGDFPDEQEFLAALLEHHRKVTA
jgi:3-hydroxyisobutyrate dehydrogenase-like beta-hydroxyacid dehydrogenase